MSSSKFGKLAFVAVLQLALIIFQLVHPTCAESNKTAGGQKQGQGQSQTQPMPPEFAKVFPGPKGRVTVQQFNAFGNLVNSVQTGAPLSPQDENEIRTQLLQTDTDCEGFQVDCSKKGECSKYPVPLWTEVCDKMMKDCCKEESSSSLPVWAIALIVIVALLIVAGIVGAIVFFLVIKPKRNPNQIGATGAGAGAQPEMQGYPTASPMESQAGGPSINGGT